MVNREEIQALLSKRLTQMDVISLAEKAMQAIQQRDNLFKLAKALLIATGQSEKEVMALLFRRLHGGSNDVTPKPKSPYELENPTHDRD